jgi:acetyltransferase-like isoleucine patch superfamily enzyme
MRIINLIEHFIAKLIKKMRLKSVVESTIHKTSKVESGSHIVSTTFDKYSFCGYDCQIINASIGSFCSIANNVIIGGAMHPITWVSTSPVFYLGRDSVRKKFSLHLRPNDMHTVIGHDVWIGQNAMIKQGVVVGIGAVVGMGSVVTKNVEPFSIVVGNPAVEIRKRFDEQTIKRLLESKWWEKSDDELSFLARNITNPDLFLNENLNEVNKTNNIEL